MALFDSTSALIPLSADKVRELDSALSGLTGEQLAWVSGYVYSFIGREQPAPTQVDKTQPNLTIVYGSQTGNARALAESLLAQALDSGLAATVTSMSDYREKRIADEHCVVFLVSTHGEGEPPDDAIRLHRFLGSKRAPRLESLSYMVLGLGDSSYEYFCKTAQDFDEMLSALGAKPLLPRVDCDVDYEDDANSWSADALKAFSEHYKDQQSVVVPIRKAQSASADGNASSKNDRWRTLSVLNNQKITSDDAVGSVSHVELLIEDDALSYKSGDALGVRFQNEAALVERTLEVTGLDADAGVTVDNESVSLHHALTHSLELSRLHPSVLRRWAEQGGNADTVSLVEDRAKVQDYIYGRQLPDFLQEHAWKGEPEELVKTLQKMQPRLYSIASSQMMYSDEVHLSVTPLQYEFEGRDYRGSASGFLCDRIETDDEVSVYVAENSAFHLPSDTSTPIIMIGAGTGIAPFRAFMQQREASGAEGSNWLIFGNRNFQRDFLYQTDWLQYREQGLLQKLDVAFSRDEGGCYVQHRLAEHGKELYSWLEEGAHFYVCGAKRMGDSVHKALLEAVAGHGGLKHDAAEEYVASLQDQGRYHKDIY